MGAGDLLLLIMRWAHSLATIVWLGGGAYSTLIQRRELAQLADAEQAAQFNRATGARFGRWLNAAMIVFIVSGVILTADRLTSRGATVAYGVTLVLKIALVLWMFGLARRFGQRRVVPTGPFANLRRQLGSPQALLWLGAVIVLLAAVLKTLYELALQGR